MRVTGTSVAIALFSILLVSSDPRADEAATLTETAASWLASLDGDQRETVLYEFEDPERFDLRLAPLFLEGLRRDAMTEAQWVGLRGVLATTLSPEGLRKVETVMSLEREVLRRDERGLLSSWFGGFVHGENRYYLALFGEPAPGRPWGMRLDGHHVSLNWTVPGDGAVSTTPVFLGAEPREVPQGWERAGLQALAEEEEAARALWQALSADQRGRAELPFQSASGPAGGNRPLFLGEGEAPDLAEPVGIARADLQPDQRDLLEAVVETYLSLLAAPVRDARRRAIDEGGRDRLHFAWAGSFTPGEPLYYRLQGPTLLIEFDNTVAEADHIHTIVRDLEADFGRDLLASHYRLHHVAVGTAGGAR